MIVVIIVCSYIMSITSLLHGLSSNTPVFIPPSSNECHALTVPCVVLTHDTHIVDNRRAHPLPLNSVHSMNYGRSPCYKMYTHICVFQLWFSYQPKLLYIILAFFQIISCVIQLRNKTHNLRTLLASPSLYLTRYRGPQLFIIINASSK